MVTTFKRSYGCTATLIAIDPATVHCQPTTPAETPGLSQASLSQSLVGSLLLSPGSWWVQGFDCALQESVFPVLYKFWQLYGGVIVTSSKRRSHPGLLHPEPLPLGQATADLCLCRRHSNTQRQVWPSLCGVSWCTQGFV